MKVSFDIDYTYVRNAYEALRIDTHWTNRPHRITARANGDYIVASVLADADSLHDMGLDIGLYMTPDQAATLRDALTSALAEN